MVEIYLLFKWGRQLGAMCREAGLRAGRYQLLMVGCWFGGEFLGAIFGSLIGMLIGDETIEVLLSYGFALFCAAQAVKYPFRLVERKRIQEEPRWTCESCGEPVIILASTCPMCGAVRQTERELDPRFAGVIDTAAPTPRDQPDFSFLPPEN